MEPRNMAVLIRSRCLNFSLRGSRRFCLFDSYETLQSVKTQKATVSPMGMLLAGI